MCWLVLLVVAVVCVVVVLVVSVVVGGGDVMCVVFGGVLLVVSLLQAPLRCHTASRYDELPTPLTCIVARLARRLRCFLYTCV